MNHTILRPDMSVIDAGQIAAKAGAHLICNGRESRISSNVPHGWFRIAVKIKPTTSTPGGMPCAA